MRGTKWEIKFYLRLHPHPAFSPEDRLGGPKKRNENIWQDLLGLPLALAVAFQRRRRKVIHDALVAFLRKRRLLTFFRPHIHKSIRV